MIKRKRNKTMHGFTLIELMITVAIIGIIAMIAIPSYRDNQLKTHRDIAKADMIALEAAIQKYHINSMSYSGVDASLYTDVSPRDASNSTAASLNLASDTDYKPVNGSGGTVRYKLVVTYASDTTWSTNVPGGNYIIQAIPTEIQRNGVDGSGRHTGRLLIYAGGGRCYDSAGSVASAGTNATNAACNNNGQESW